MNILLFIYVFSLFVITTPNVLFKIPGKYGLGITILHAIVFTCVLYFTYDIVSTSIVEGIHVEVSADFPLIYSNSESNNAYSSNSMSDSVGKPQTASTPPAPTPPISMQTSSTPPTSMQTSSTPPVSTQPLSTQPASTQSSSTPPVSTQSSSTPPASTPPASMQTSSTPPVGLATESPYRKQACCNGDTYTGCIKNNKDKDWCLTNTNCKDERCKKEDAVKAAADMEKADAAKGIFYVSPYRKQSCCNGDTYTGCYKNHSFWCSIQNNCKDTGCKKEDAEKAVDDMEKADATKGIFWTTTAPKATGNR